MGALAILNAVDKSLAESVSTRTPQPSFWTRDAQRYWSPKLQDEDVRHRKIGGRTVAHKGWMRVGSPARNEAPVVPAPPWWQAASMRGKRLIGVVSRKNALQKEATHRSCAIERTEKISSGSSTSSLTLSRLSDQPLDRMTRTSASITAFTTAFVTAAESGTCGGRISAELAKLFERPNNKTHHDAAESDVDDCLPVVASLLNEFEKSCRRVPNLVRRVVEEPVACERECPAISEVRPDEKAVRTRDKDVIFPVVRLGQDGRRKVV